MTNAKTNLHRRSRRGNDLVIVNLDLTLRHLVEALVNDSERLSEFLDSAQVSIVAISVLSDRYVKLDLVVRVVRSNLSVNGEATRSACFDERVRRERRTECPRVLPILAA